MSGAASWDAKRTQPASDAEAYAWECAENMRGWALRAVQSNRELRGQLDAARQALKRIEFYPFDVMSDAVTDLAAVREIARAALGVEGEDAKP